MASPGLTIAVLMLGLSGPPAGDRPAPPTPRSSATATVIFDVLDTYAEPEASAFVDGTLKKGETVVVVDDGEAPGWLAIEPPPTAFDWVPQSGVRPEGPGIARVTAASAAVRLGVSGARLPGPERSALKRGATVRLVDRPALVIGTGPNPTTWLAIAPPQSDVRYVQTVGVTWSSPKNAAQRDERLASFEPRADLPAGTAASIKQIESEHRAAVSGPLENWQLEPIKARYEALLKSAADPESAGAIQARLAIVERHAEVARSARTIRAILERSHRRDQAVAVTRRRLAALDAPRKGSYIAEGLVQPSSRQIEGRRVFALIGPDGVPLAYLDIPPGLDARPVTTRKVGVRGNVRYDETLNARVIAVRDIEPLD